MAMETDQLVQCLVAQVEPVRRLPPPWRRSLLWLNLSLLYIAVVAGIHLVASGEAGPIGVRLVLEQAAMLATAVTAAIAAFSSVVPGRDRRYLLVPLGPLSVWLVTLGQGCLHDWQTHGAAGLLPGSDWDCALPAVILGILPAIAMVVMLRRGAPLVPRMSMGLGALAVAALASLGLRVFHAGDFSIQILVWHLGGATVLAVAVSQTGHRLLNWRALVTRNSPAVGRTLLVR